MTAKQQQQQQEESHCKGDNAVVVSCELPEVVGVDDDAGIAAIVASQVAVAFSVVAIVLLSSCELFSDNQRLASSCVEVTCSK